MEQPFETNRKLERIFSEMSAMCKYGGTGERFRALAYDRAARLIGGLPEDISSYYKNTHTTKIPGIGKSVSGKIQEFLQTGRIGKYEQMKKWVPYDLLEIMDIKGFGPQTIRRIHDQLNINTREELMQALLNGSISGLKGFGSKKVESMLRGLKLHKTVESRMLLWDALEKGEQIISLLKRLPEVKQAGLAGSLRRREETIGDIDILVSCEPKSRKKIVSWFTAPDMAEDVLIKGDTKVSIILKDTGRQADLRIVDEEDWGSALQYFTGSKEHNIRLRAIAKEKGYKISEYGIFSLKNQKQRIGGKEEEEIYRILGFRMMPPEIRRNEGELETSACGKISRLVSKDDIKGDLHVHSAWSDGINTIEDIVKYVRKNFSYGYLAITDHSKSSRVANGMNEKQMLKQIKAIERINERLEENFVKAGIELDILADGSLDISDEVLSQLDWVVASIHSGFTKDNTERIIRACENPYVCCIGHPTGRLIGIRDSYRLDMRRVMEAALYTSTALEINAQPRRMDLRDEYVKSARGKGVKLVINTDSHSFDNFQYMKMGVSIARRGWCAAEDILNTKSWNEIEQWRKRKLKSLAKV